MSIFFILGFKFGVVEFCLVVLLVVLLLVFFIVLVVLSEVDEFWEVCGVYGLGNGFLFFVREG